jgi:predicted AAA+ superfamily ATPase
VDRGAHLDRIGRAFKVHPVVGLLGPRQCGKTTLARMFAQSWPAAKGGVHRFDLEDPETLARFAAPMLALRELQGLIVIDEIQRAPEIFPVLRVLADDPARRKHTRFLILGSASRDLIRQGSESLAGRIQYVELPPFSAAEVGRDRLRRLWTRGGFPPAFLASSEARSVQWRKSYIATYLERDIPALGFQIPPATLRRFWMMLTHYHGQMFNASEIGRSLGAADTTVRRYLEILAGTFMVRLLPPWIENLAKRQVKTPKVYFRDSGIFHTLLGVSSEAELRTNPKLGASWEGFALEEVVRARAAEPEDVYFWGTHGAAELDLLIVRDGRREGYEFKFTDRPAITRSMRLALADLALDQLTVIFPGDGTFPLDEKIRASGLARFVAGD